MIRKTIALSIVLLAISAAVTLTGCKKEEPAKVDPAADVKEAVDQGMGDADHEDHTGHDHE